MHVCSTYATVCERCGGHRPAHETDTPLFGKWRMLSLKKTELMQHPAVTDIRPEARHPCLAGASRDTQGVDVLPTSICAMQDIAVY